ncbi:GIY-YIG nuclease family protein [Patescibacteria group bacterium]|jgi:putative endonuclease|nr:GIY-YIG nuclease family protein [Patescibacteria group bacterium]
MYYVYFIESEKLHRRYIGFSENIEQRIQYHNQGKNVSTRYGSPWRLIYYEAYLSKADALGRERFLKSGAGWRYLRKQLANYLLNQK